jgi:signal transduction histidine kinase
LCVLDLFVSWDPDRGGAAGGWLTPTYAAVGYTLLIWRRRAPRRVFAGVLVHSLLAWLVTPGYAPTLGVWLALYTVATRCDLRWAWSALLAAFAPAALNVAYVVEHQAPGDRLDALVVSAVGTTMVNVAIFAVGRWAAWSVRQRRSVGARAAAAAVADERSRIARDLHDIVAHAVTLMLLQAGGAARLLSSDPARAEAALRHVDRLGQQAIVELHRLLGLLSTEPADEYEAFASSSRLGNIGELVAQLTTPDLTVRVEVTGEPVPLDPGVDLSAYRILQEALTNAARYADRRRPVLVQVRWADRTVEIGIVNYRQPVQRQSRAYSTGRGLIGMRERAQAAGGEFDAGPRSDGRYSVRARMPVAAPLSTGAGHGG